MNAADGQWFYTLTEIALLWICIGLFLVVGYVRRAVELLEQIKGALRQK